jgi:hypothetical protein
MKNNIANLEQLENRIDNEGIFPVRLNVNVASDTKAYLMRNAINGYPIGKQIDNMVAIAERDTILRKIP